MPKYKIVCEKSDNGFSAYVPSLPGCTSAGATRKELQKNIAEAIKLHTAVMRETKKSIERGLADVKAGRVTPHKLVRKLYKKWLK